MHCVFVDNGLLRQEEGAEVIKLLSGLGLSVELADASKEFFSALKGVIDPEEKRKIIGRVFIEVFDEQAKKTAFWNAFKTLGPWWAELPPY